MLKRPGSAPPHLHTAAAQLCPLDMQGFSKDQAVHAYHAGHLCTAQGLQRREWHMAGGAAGRPGKALQRCSQTCTACKDVRQAQGTCGDRRRDVCGGAAGARCHAAGARRAHRRGCARRAAGAGGFSASACVSSYSPCVSVHSGPRRANGWANGQVLYVCTLKSCNSSAFANACSHEEAMLIHYHFECRLTSACQLSMHVIVSLAMQSPSLGLG